MLIRRLNLTGYRGFSMIELMIVVAIMSIVVALSMPSFSKWIQNTKVRTVAESIKTGLQLAQAESARRSRQVTFNLTTATPGLDVTPDSAGTNWSIQTLALLTGEAAEFIEGSNLAGTQNGVATAGVATLTFNSMGRLTGAVTSAAYNITRTGSDRPLRVTVTPSGRVRMCDPSLTLSSSNPTGC
jgi:type IV fimbrial biogenesis protein FimT